MWRQQIGERDVRKFQAKVVEPVEDREEVERVE